MTAKGYTFTRPAALLKIERIKALLADLDHTQLQLARKLHTTDRNLGEYMAHLHGQGLVHIVDWHHPPRGNPVPIYRGGPGKDAPRPKPQTERQYTRRYLAKVRADLDRHDRYLARRRDWWHRNKTQGGKLAPDPAAAWLTAPIPQDPPPQQEETTHE